jgi:TATA-box binding protein (TBP) (component of TFIID and TFIIIB)
MFQIVNIKISVKIKPILLTEVTKILTDNSIPYRKFCNFVTFSKGFNFIIFKTGAKGQNHINVTNLKVDSDIKIVENILRDQFNFEIIDVITDNIVAKSSLLKKINLSEIAEKEEFSEIKYNPERFPGLFIKFRPGTCILFHSGKIVIVGCKKVEKVADIIANLKSRL